MTNLVVKLTASLPIARKEFVKRGGTIISVTPEQRASWAARLPNLSDAWVAAMQRKGLPGRAILADYMQIMRDNKAANCAPLGSEGYLK